MDAALMEPMPPLAFEQIASSTPNATEKASCGGHGTKEMLELSRLLEEHGIICCMTGVSALIFYGAGRIRHEWEVCVASEQIEDALALLRVPDLQSKYPPVTKQPLPQPASLTHTYARFGGKNGAVQFVLVPAEDAHIHCDASTICRSHNGLPYPSLPTLVQSFIDTYNEVDLCDVIDGANLTEEWGNIHLALDGTNDWKWAKRMNQRVRSAGGGDPLALFGLFPSAHVSRRDLWEVRVRGKKARMGWTQPEELFETRFRLKGSVDPWTEYSIAS